MQFFPEFFHIRGLLEFVSRSRWVVSKGDEFSGSHNIKFYCELILQKARIIVHCTKRTDGSESSWKRHWVQKDERKALDQIIWQCKYANKIALHETRKHLLAKKGCNVRLKSPWTKSTRKTLVISKIGQAWKFDKFGNMTGWEIWRVLAKRECNIRLKTSLTKPLTKSLVTSKIGQAWKFGKFGNLTSFN